MDLDTAKTYVSDHILTRIRYRVINNWQVIRRPDGTDMEWWKKLELEYATFQSKTTNVFFKISGYEL